MLHSGVAAACVLLLGAVVPASAQIAVHFVPGEFATIQEALDASSDGDVIVVWPGTWTGPLDTQGLDIEIRALSPYDGDYTLEPGSPCIKSGNPVFTDPDFSPSEMGRFT